ncbi:hypothetical protein [Pseudalkalibacillus caeni]|uniref:Uncharacterized protein n=1 Tax=Exobacillus caeni TaxID=2574798 RepID=A0A5R9FCE5_9BACL|nr:hypothetical protein [Pseudalkalibacillus caeni]TLS38224.1 hypothetical protein FCL54_06725 [Pseudalkalibacillus caeni]
MNFSHYEIDAMLQEHRNHLQSVSEHAWKLEKTALAARGRRFSFISELKNYFKVTKQECNGCCEC